MTVNDFIGGRGSSGSSRGANFIANAIEESRSTTRLTPSDEPKQRAARLMHMLWWDFIHVPRRASDAGSTIIVHATNTGNRLRHQSSVVVMHDTMVLDHPHLFASSFRRYARAIFPLSVQRASLVVTPSQHSKTRVLSRWPAAEVVVIPWPAPTTAVRAPQNSASNSIVVVSSVDKHKRLAIAVAAVSRARDELSRDFQLSLVTRPGNDRAALDAAIRRHDPEGVWITELSGVSEDRLDNLYSNAFCVVVSSLDEGYCLPAVESAARAVPVVHTGRGALPEVTAVNVTPATDPDADLDVLSDQIVALGSNDDLYRQTSESSLLIAKALNWDTFAGQWSRVIESLEVRPV